MIRESAAIWALLPTKMLDRAKTRLAGVLSPAQRRALVLAMAEDVLATLVRAPALAGVALLSRDQAVRELGRRYNALLLDDPSSELNESLEAGRTQLHDLGASAMLVVPADVPLISAADVATLSAAIEQGADLVLAPDREASGTNALALKLNVPFRFQFGLHSFQVHQSQARHNNLALRIHRSHTLGLDIDTFDDLCLLSEMSGAQTTQALLRETLFEPLGRLVCTSE